MSNKVLTLKNYFFVDQPQAQQFSLTTWISNLMLHGKKSRLRTRFLKLLNDRMTEIEKIRKELLIKHSEKKTISEVEGEEKEMPIFIDKDGKESTDGSPDGLRYKLKDQKAFSEEINKYLQEDCVIDVTPATRESIYAIRDLLLDENLGQGPGFSGRMATNYNEWCEAFEKIEKVDEKKPEEGSEKK